MTEVPGINTSAEEMWRMAKHIGGYGIAAMNILGIPDPSLVETLHPSDPDYITINHGPRSFGPKCKCHGERNMKRTAPLVYACQKSGQVFQLKELLWPK